MDWSEVEPVLAATYRLLEQDDQVKRHDVFVALGVPTDDSTVMRALALLHKAEYIGGITVWQEPAPVLITATEKGLKCSSGWPGDAGNAVDLLLRVLDEAIANEATSDEERSRIRRVRGAFASLSREVAVEIMASYLSRTSGLG